jgi:peptide deformylase
VQGRSEVAAEPSESAGQEASDAFVAELRHWREVAGYSQKALAKKVGYDASYVSKVERGTVIPSRSFAEQADQHMRAGRALVKRWKELHDTAPPAARGRQEHPLADDPRSAPGPGLVVEHEHAELVYIDHDEGGRWRTWVRRQLHNVGTEPVAQYLIRIAVDRYPGDPERSNRLYREDPLTWDEIGLSARCGDEPMTWRVKHDRDAFKELWLLFENADGKFPLYPGETAWIEYTYTVGANKWGPWWQRAIRLPTRRLSLVLDFPKHLKPAVWGLETSMTAEASPFRSPLLRECQGDRVVFSWSTDEPPMHARYRIEWKLKGSGGEEEAATMDTMSPSERMRSLEIAQEGDAVLAEVARPFDLPVEAEDARRVVTQLSSTLERVGQVHKFTKGMGLAAPQVNIGRSAAIVRTPDGQSITLLNPRVIDESSEVDEQYEGCLSFFDVRGMVPRPLAVEVEHQDVDGTVRITAFEQATARLVCHEIDHLYGRLYLSRMRSGVTPIPVSQYRGTGKRWGY